MCQQNNLDSRHSIILRKQSRTWLQCMIGYMHKDKPLRLKVMQKLRPIRMTLKIHITKYISIYEYAYLHMNYEYMHIYLILCHYLTKPWKNDNHFHEHYILIIAHIFKAISCKMCIPSKPTKVLIAVLYFVTLSQI